MKRIFLSVALLISTLSYAQTENDKVEYSKIIVLDSNLKAETLYSKAQLFARTDDAKFSFSNGERQYIGLELMGAGVDKKDIRAKDIIENKAGFSFANNEENTVVAKMIVRYEGSALGCPRLLLVQSDVFLRCKDGKTKIDITNISYDHYNMSTGRQMQLYGWSDKGDCASTGTMENLKRCNHCKSGLDKFYDYFEKCSTELINEYEKHMTTKTTEQDDW